MRRRDEQVFLVSGLIEEGEARRTYVGCRLETVPGVGMRPTELRKLEWIGVGRGVPASLAVRGE
jgi:hypothetical protein